MKLRYFILLIITVFVLTGTGEFLFQESVFALAPSSPFEEGRTAEQIEIPPNLKGKQIAAIVSPFAKDDVFFVAEEELLYWDKVFSAEEIQEFYRIHDELIEKMQYLSNNPKEIDPAGMIAICKDIIRLGEISAKMFQKEELPADLSLQINNVRQFSELMVVPDILQHPGIEDCMNAIMAWGLPGGIVNELHSLFRNRDRDYRRLVVYDKNGEKILYKNKCKFNISSEGQKNSLGVIAAIFLYMKYYESILSDYMRDIIVGDNSILFSFNILRDYPHDLSYTNLFLYKDEKKISVKFPKIERYNFSKLREMMLALDFEEDATDSMYSEFTFSYKDVNEVINRLHFVFLGTALIDVYGGVDLADIKKTLEELTQWNILSYSPFFSPQSLSAGWNMGRVITSLDELSPDTPRILLIENKKEVLEELFRHPEKARQAGAVLVQGDLGTLSHFAMNMKMLGIPAVAIGDREIRPGETYRVHTSPENTRIERISDQLLYVLHTCMKAKSDTSGQTEKELILFSVSPQNLSIILEFLINNRLLTGRWIKLIRELMKSSGYAEAAKTVDFFHRELLTQLEVLLLTVNDEIVSMRTIEEILTALQKIQYLIHDINNLENAFNLSPDLEQFRDTIEKTVQNALNRLESLPVSEKPSEPEISINEDIFPEVNVLSLDDSLRVGLKAAYLSEAMHMYPDSVPPAFSIPRESMESILESVDAIEYLKTLDFNRGLGELSKEINIWLQQKLENSDQKKMILEQYTKFFPRETKVAVRSSDITEDATFSGLYKTFLNISGSDELINAIIDSWAHAIALKMIRNDSVPAIKELATPLIIQKMVGDKGQPAASGIISTFDGIHWNNFIINVGEGAEKGSVGTGVDQVIISKKPGIPAFGTTRHLSIKNQQILAEVAGAIEEKIGPVNIEFATDSDGKLYILQVTPLVYQIDTLPVLFRWFQDRIPSLPEQDALQQAA